MPLDAAGHHEQFLGDGRDAQDVAQRQHASLVRGVVADPEDHPDDGLRAQRRGDERAGQRAAGELGWDLVVERLRERAGADEREDGGVGTHAAPPSPRRRLRP